MLTTLKQGSTGDLVKVAQYLMKYSELGKIQRGLHQMGLLDQAHGVKLQRMLQPVLLVKIKSLPTRVLYKFWLVD